MKMKKLIAGALAMAMALSLVACGGGDKPTTSQGNTPSLYRQPKREPDPQRRRE